MVVPLASVLTFVEQRSQWALLLMFALLTLESFGLPVPGETALLACAVLASQARSRSQRCSPSVCWRRSSATPSATELRAREDDRCLNVAG